MNRTVLLTLAISAFLTATAFRFALTSSSGVKRETAPSIINQKKLSIRCAPDYIPSAEESIPPLTGWGNYKWKITTTSDSAQFYFNQGMAMYFAFHIIESRASFDKATRYDPSCAMAWWGKALAFGPNINDFGYQRPSEAFPSASKASSLKAMATPLEKALIDAIAVRYSADSTKDQMSLNGQYKEAMSRVNKQFAQNADVVTLYADALMLLHPWDLYNHDYSAKQWTPEIVATIRQALKLSPNHPGANHYFIHAVEASARPADALKSARFLAKAMPNVSHITHMPSHIYIRTGDYNNGIAVNTKAVEGYQKYLTAFAPTAEGMPLYSLHNIHMKMACAQMAGSYQVALSAAKELQAQIPEFYLTMGGPLASYVQYLHQSPLLTYIRFGKWEEVLKDAVVDSLAYTAVLQHFGRGLAFAKTGRLPEALAEATQLGLKLQEPVLKEPLAPFNTAQDAGLVALSILNGVIATQQNNLSLAIEHFEKAVKREDSLIYNEPRDWLLPARHYLGDVLLRAGRNEEALAVLQKDLQINPSNGWALTGMQLAFEQLNRTNAISTARQRVKTAWLVSDSKIKRPVF